MDLASSFRYNLPSPWQVYNSLAKPYPWRFVLPIHVDPSTPEGKNLSPLSYTSAAAKKAADGKVRDLVTAALILCVAFLYWLISLSVLWAHSLPAQVLAAAPFLAKGKMQTLGALWKEWQSRIHFCNGVFWHRSSRVHIAGDFGQLSGISRTSAKASLLAKPN